jgi:SagB-type dehydrogenase family enzyme
MKSSIKTPGWIILTIILIGFSYTYAQELPKIILPAPQTDIGKPLMQTLMLRQSSRSFNTTELSLQELSNLLWAADGINRPESGKRTAPSAMNRQDIEIYVCLEKGTYVYDAKANNLNPVQSGDLRAFCGTQDFVKSAPLNLVYIADFSKVGGANEDDKNLYSAADCGFIAQNVYLYCASQNLAVVVRASIDRKKLAEVLKLKSNQKIILSQTVGYNK